MRVEIKTFQTFKNSEYFLPIYFPRKLEADMGSKKQIQQTGGGRGSWELLGVPKDSCAPGVGGGLLAQILPRSEGVGDNLCWKR